MEIPKITNGDSLKQMIEMQKSLLDKYIVIEGLPKYPIDINDRSGQKLIKDFIRRYIEELAEAFQELQNAYDRISTNQLGSAKISVRDYNQEIADANHFLLEILIYVGIEVDELDIMIANLFKENNTANLHKPEDPITSLLNATAFYNHNQGLIISNRNCFRVYSNDETLRNPEFKGGNQLSEEVIEKSAAMLWMITYSLNMVGNLLKNKDWSQTDKITNTIEFKEGLLKTLLVIFQYLQYSGFTVQSIFTGYYLKNQINHERIKNGY